MGHIHGFVLLVSKLEISAALSSPLIRMNPICLNKNTLFENRAIFQMELNANCRTELKHSSVMPPAITKAHRTGPDCQIDSIF